MKTTLFAFLFLIFTFPAMAQDQVQVLKPVKAEYVCMVNDTAFDKPQIPVEVNGKTYYGCCMMCKDRLEKDTAIRSALDPVSGAEVDKAESVIGEDAEYKVYYFENKENLEAFGMEQSSNENVE